MSAPSIEIVLASAGSGKTWALSSRYLRLLAQGAGPRSILASTFTRKAAGEILGRVLSRLAHAAGDDAASVQLSRDLGLTPRTRAQFAALLSELVRDVQRFRVQTLDSFFVELAGSLAADVGIAPEWTIADDLARERAQAQAASAALDASSTEQWALLLTGATGHAAARGVHATLMAQVGAAYALALESDADDWGRVDELTPLDFDEREQLFARLRRAPLPTNARGVANGHFQKALATLLTALENDDWQTIATASFGKPVIAGATEYHSHEMDAELIAAVEAVVRHAAACVSRDVARRSRAARALLDLFGAHYSRLQSRDGLLAFDDLPRALVRSGASTVELARRLDASIDHILLDEFQDTAPAQWRVLEPLVDELRADASRERSVFVVGDPKQSIYGWRAGDPRLLELLPEMFGVRATTRDQSHRSAQTVLDAVNRVFGSITGSPEYATHADEREVAARFEAGFRAHSAVHRELSGEVRVHTCAAADASEEAQEFALQRAVEIVLEIHRDAPAATIAVLTRRGRFVPRLVYLLRQRGVVASGESGNQLGDSAAVQCALSLLTWIDHPDDSAAQFHVAVSPFAQALGIAREMPHGAARRLASELRARLARLGMPAFLGELRQPVERGYSAWDVRRFGQLVDAALTWREAAGVRTVDFVERARTQAVDDSSAALVKVMTIHSAKGLEFDAVVLPDLDFGLSRRMPNFRWFRASEDPRSSIECVVRAPDKNLRALLGFAGERRVAAAHRSSLERAMHDELSALYVALTRAVHRLDLVVRPTLNTQARFCHAAFVRHAFELGVEALAESSVVAEESTNDPAWMAWKQLTQSSARGDRDGAARVTFARGSRPRELERTRPSSVGESRALDTAKLFERENTAALARGSRWHAWFEHVEWLEDFRDGDTALLAQARALGLGGDGLEHDLAAFRAALERPNLRRTLARREHCEVWRERRFALVFDAGTVDARLLTGAFDRVVIERIPGRPARAEIVDFKTGVVDASALGERADHYRPQLATYRTALARIAALEPAAISAKLVFAESDLVVEL